MLAHIIPGTNYASQWLGALLLFAGLFAAIVLKHKTWRIFSGIGAICGLTITIISGFSAMPSLNYTISLVTSARSGQATTPLRIMLCKSDGAEVMPSSNIVDTLLDGKQSLETTSTNFAMQLANGKHSLTAELLTSQHKEFSPPARATIVVTIIGQGVLSTSPKCKL